MPNVIHFMDLEDMIPDLTATEPVRINRHIELSHSFANMPDLGLFQIGVHVRQAQGNTVYSWMMPTGEFQATSSGPITDEHEKARDDAWAEAELIEQMVKDRLEAEDTFIIKPGIIDLGTAGYMVGTWSNLEVIHGDEEMGDSEQVRDSDPDPDLAF